MENEAVEEHVEDSRDPDRVDGEQTPTTDDLPEEEGDAGVNDQGAESWYEGGGD